MNLTPSRSDFLTKGLRRMCNHGLQAVAAANNKQGFSPSTLQINKYWQDWLIVKIGIKAF
jgi:hypothetical protein